MTSSFELDCDERAPATARRCLRDALSGGLVEPPLDARVADVELLVSELVSNAVRHGRCSRTELTVVIVPPASLHVEVRDPGLGGVVQPRPAQLDGTGGVGLHLVEQLASRWGTALADEGRTVWFEIDLHAPATLR